MQYTIFSLLALVATTLALPQPLVTPEGTAVASRQNCYATCGSTCYYEATIDNAVNQGYSDYQDGDAPGGYPHTYNDYEGFDFPVSGPYQEFPVLHSYQVYTGGSPGADRVVFNTNGEYAGSITHTGASGNNFVQCS